MTLPSRQGLEQLAIVLALGAIVFGLFALVRWRRDREWRRYAISSGAIGCVIAAVVALAYTVAPNIPIPAVPFAARFAQYPVPDSPEVVAAGHQAYQANCVVCHGARGRGDGPAAFTLDPRPFDLIVHVPQHAPGELEYWIAEGIPGTAMPSWKDKLSEEQRWQVVRFLEALAAGRA